MKKQKAFDLAKEAGIPFNKWGLIGCDTCEEDIDEALQRFAALVAAARDKFWDEQIAVEIHEAVLEEREACAVIAETPVSGEQDDITMQAKDRAAAAIRARQSL
jgi:hypothetical protein